MVQESTMICVDNSEYMRNGDFQPTRLQSQQDAVNLVTQCKLRANPENAVGILSMANSVQVLSSLSTEQGRLMMKNHSIEPFGKCNFIAGIKIAHLALKHRQNRNHKMRVVLFIGSPLEEIEMNELVKIAKKMKKEKVLCDVIMFGENESDGHEKFSTFVDTLNGKEGSGSSLIVVPQGSSLTDALLQSSVCKNEDGQAAFGGGGNGMDNAFGMDVENDPDLALALRVSMEEERARQAAAAAANGGAADSGADAEVAAAAAAVPLEEMDMGAMTEEQQLEWALRLSMQENAPAEQPQVQHEQMDVDGAPAVGGDNLDDLMNNPELLQQIVDDLPAANAEKDDDKEKK
ncbi:26S proteasome non-ATPase regulatory subunit 4 [Caenorhabditis elegans]|uniref:26S proteasome non-ATPase regulatory subunit 4 n=1 Tax=Caenorhabditis elegans TaxID=6239 RepID=PSMD4_CAEEL|nr:26S proteasome non-ATPase regulatory subunit 4 [Caenorhabditis elegans]O61742.2 RecName: Full=26S proteasome non-ATPase regulatory subunit 4; AltName: Full=26S proteasome regulatory subunit rpn-10 [Caenorhabditis elegans]CCD61298.1 26S proteasome non-ATPase regulatory subunit 4 [Caenorhabditis elegans]|eukprot:NP_492809.1 26S proteasome non-ATPase regulatory subunit 4 [Caenorhabditis elegans]